MPACPESAVPGLSCGHGAVRPQATATSCVRPSLRCHSPWPPLLLAGRLVAVAGPSSFRLTLRLSCCATEVRSYLPFLLLTSFFICGSCLLSCATLSLLFRTFMSAFRALPSHVVLCLPLCTPSNAFPQSPFPHPASLPLSPSPFLPPSPYPSFPPQPTRPQPG